MLINTIFFISYSISILFSILGYGIFFTNKIFNNNKYLNLSLIGLFGILFIYLISSITHLFTSHNYIHNFTLLIIGVILFYRNFKKINNYKKQLKVIIFFFLCLFLGFLISKTNEDFPYYHLPNSLQFSLHKLEFGLGNLSHGFKHFSSLFLINSLFYLPFIEIYLFNITNFMLQIFFFSGLTFFIFQKEINNFTKMLIAFTLITYLVKFSRLAEYGADYMGQFLVLMGVIIASISFSKKKLSQNENKNIFYMSILLIVFSITTKFLYAIYLIIPFLIFLKKFKYHEIFEIILNKNFLIISLILIASTIFFNFTATGCFLYPIKITCFTESVDWSLSSKTIDYLNLHYKAWSKAGIGAGYGLLNQQEYISGLNWVDNWFEKYFFNKVSDYILVVLFIILIFLIFYWKNLKKNKKKDFDPKYFKISYFSILIVFVLWFLNFPTLRYAGYTVVFLLTIFPFCLFFSQRINLNEKMVLQKFKILTFIALIIFNLKNLQRLDHELNLNSNEHHNFYNFPFYWVDDVKYKEIIVYGKLFYLVTNNKSCWNVPATCLRDRTYLDIEKKNGYFFYKKK